MLFASREVRIGKNLTRGLKYDGRGPYSKTEGKVLTNTDRPRSAKNEFIFFLYGIAFKAALLLNFN